jgi:hypothetical protein
MQAPTHILPVSFLCFPYATILFTPEVNLFLASIAIKVFPCVLHGHKDYPSDLKSQVRSFYDSPPEFPVAT